MFFEIRMDGCAAAEPEDEDFFFFFKPHGWMELEAKGPLLEGGWGGEHTQHGG